MSARNSRTAWPRWRRRSPVTGRSSRCSHYPRTAVPTTQHREENDMPPTNLPPWIQALQQRDPHFVESYMSQREHILKDGAIPAKYKHLMTMMVDALQSHPDGVATIANRA